MYLGATVEHLGAQTLDKAIVAAGQFLQPGIEVIHRLQAAGKPQQFFAPAARQPAEEFFKTFQQVDLAQCHIDRQARSQLPGQLIEPRAQQICLGHALFGRAG
ncbi:hypothetical protein D3C77_81120 [compost metagenome]